MNSGMILLLVMLSGMALPYPFVGHVYDENNNPVEDILVTIINQRTGDEMSFTTDETGEYQMSASNFKSGYKNGDIIKYNVNYKNSTVLYNLKIDTSKLHKMVDFTPEGKIVSNINEESEGMTQIPTISFLMCMTLLIIGYKIRRHKK